MIEVQGVAGFRLQLLAIITVCLFSFLKFLRHFPVKHDQCGRFTEPSGRFGPHRPSAAWCFVKTTDLG